MKKFFINIWKYISKTNTRLLLTITITVFVLMYLLAMIFIGRPFTNPQTFFDLINVDAGTMICACGMSVVMIAGGIDISVGGVVALVCMCSAVYLDRLDGNLFGAILISLGIGLAFGIVQGFLVAYLNIQPFIVTLAGMFFARGMTTIVCKAPFNIENPSFVALKDVRIPLPFGYFAKNGTFINVEVEIGYFIAIFVVAVLFFVLKFTSFGRSLYAVGGNAQSALMLGINVKRTKFMSHILCGTLAGVAGFAYFIHVGSGSPFHATGMEMNAIASSIIGGTLLTGGVGNIIGTLFGVMNLNAIKNIVGAAGLSDAWWTGITIAAMLCLFLVIQSIVVILNKNKK